jgi:hypothetical protein
MWWTVVNMVMNIPVNFVQQSWTVVNVVMNIPVYFVQQSWTVVNLVMSVQMYVIEQSIFYRTSSFITLFTGTWIMSLWVS